MKADENTVEIDGKRYKKEDITIRKDKTQLKHTPN